jgi:hypothetical protein
MGEHKHKTPGVFKGDAYKKRIPLTITVHLPISRKEKVLTSKLTIRQIAGPGIPVTTTQKKSK